MKGKENTHIQMSRRWTARTSLYWKHYTVQNTHIIKSINQVHC